ncbi:MAG: biotin carboxylase N-terminal domain-containing protein [Legionellaceae bacterium]|nr:biotin carboxylase N-terminal domain-containing protein [Legionellaceae bacterium]
MFQSLLIANRGEIACRILRTAQKLGIRSIAVYSEADKHSPHVLAADEAYFLGPSTATQSYLAIDKIMAIAQHAKAEAIHPGYGFLSENPAFAKACAQQHVVFVGPSVTALTLMGSKQMAKQHLANSAVPMTPGYHGNDPSEQTLLQEAKRIGFPILLKAAQGGGGKGMRIVTAEKDFLTALHSAEREAQASFGDHTMILEKYITHARHVEVQILADNYGLILPLFDRDCSLQRRHQKVIEEAPAPGLQQQTHEALQKAACAVAQAIQYTGAGTIEFLVDPDEQLYFMEMNTRLQVEHPVTEMISGVDLVEWQLRIAANEPLPTNFPSTPQGHAVECRIYAENPAQDFLPSVGELHILQLPQNARLDFGVNNAAFISPYYDPMIGKIITHGPDRHSALQQMYHALQQCRIVGISTNIPFLQTLCQHPEVLAGKLDIHFLDQHVLPIPNIPLTRALCFACAIEYQQVITAADADPLRQHTLSFHPFDTLFWTWRGHLQETNLEAKIIAHSANSFTCVTEDASFSITILETQPALSLEIDGVTYEARVYHEPSRHIIAFPEGNVEISAYQAQGTDVHSSNAALLAPITATVITVLKSVGDTVQQGEVVLILEAMKMEHSLHAPYDGKITEIYCESGQQVQEGKVLYEIQ